MEDVLNMIGKLALYLMTILCGLLIHSLVLLPLVFFVITRNNPYRFMKGVGDALMTAFGIASRFVACMCEHMHVKITQSNYLKRVFKGSVQPPKWSPNLKWSSTIRPRNDTDPHLHVDPEMIPNYFLKWNGFPPRNYYKSVAAFTFLNRIEHSLQFMWFFSAFVI